MRIYAPQATQVLRQGKAVAFQRQGAMLVVQGSALTSTASSASSMESTQVEVEGMPAAPEPQPGAATPEVSYGCSTGTAAGLAGPGLVVLFLGFRRQRRSPDRRTGERG